MYNPQGQEEDGTSPYAATPYVITPGTEGMSQQAIDAMGSAAMQQPVIEKVKYSESTLLKLAKEIVKNPYPADWLQTQGRDLVNRRFVGTQLNSLMQAREKEFILRQEQFKQIKQNPAAKQLYDELLAEKQKSNNAANATRKAAQNAANATRKAAQNAAAAAQKAELINYIHDLRMNDHPYNDGLLEAFKKLLEQPNLPPAIKQELQKLIVPIESEHARVERVRDRLAKLSMSNGSLAWETVLTSEEKVEALALKEKMKEMVLAAVNNLIAGKASANSSKSIIHRFGIGKRLGFRGKTASVESVIPTIEAVRTAMSQSALPSQPVQASQLSNSPLSYVKNPIVKKRGWFRGGKHKKRTHKAKKNRRRHTRKN